jgi:hypothetical protein
MSRSLSAAFAAGSECRERKALHHPGPNLRADEDPRARRGHVIDACIVALRTGASNLCSRTRSRAAATTLCDVSCPPPPATLSRLEAYTMASPDESSPPALQVAVTPSQAAFFAGEPLTVTITITNSRPPPYANGHANGTSSGSGRPFSPTSSIPGSTTRARSQSVTSPRHAHKRSSHSVSHVPIAHPPTSPGIGQIRHASSSSLSLPAGASKQVFEEVKEIRRKNRIGKGIRSAQVVHSENGSAYEKGKEKDLNVEVIQLRSMVMPDKRNVVLRGVHEDVRFAGVYSGPLSPLVQTDTR